MAASWKEAMSDEIVPLKCTLSTCEDLQQVREAVRYCLECQGYCCQSCVDKHKAFSHLKDHHLMDKSTLKSTTVLMSDLPVIPTDICDVHETKIIDMYCGNHDEVGCSSCMTLHHRNCKDVQLVSDVTDKFFKESLVTEIHQKLLEIKSETGEIRAFKEKRIEQLKKTREKAVNEIKEFRIELDAFLEKLQEESISAMEKCFDQLQSTLHNEIEKTDNALQIMDKTENNLMKSSGDRAKQFVSAKVSQKRIAETEEILQNINADVRISFAPDPNLKNYLQQFKSLGSVKHDSIPLLRQKARVYVITKARELNVKTRSDSETCIISGSHLIDDSELLLADFKNQKLKRVDILKMSVVDQCSCPYFPYSVCQTRGKEAVVTLYNSNIQFITLDGRMKTTRQIKLKHECYGIAYKNERLYISDRKKFLYIHNLAGTVLQKISTDESGNNLFKDIRHVLFSDTENKMFVTDYEEGVIALNGYMNHSYSFSDLELSGAQAICSDVQGNIFVGGKNSSNILQMGQNGKKVGVVVKSSDGLKCLEAICFDRKRCTLIITQNNSNIVKFFDLK